MTADLFIHEIVSKNFHRGEPLIIGHPEKDRYDAKDDNDPNALFFDRGERFFLDPFLFQMGFESAIVLFMQNQIGDERDQSGDLDQSCDKKSYIPTDEFRDRA